MRVAVNQAQALRAAGHDVVVAAGTRGFSRTPTEMSGVPVELFPAWTILPRTGFAGLVSPRLQRFVATMASTFDIVHIHAARDLITLPIAHRLRKAGIPFVLQTHGMIDASSHPLAGPLDRMLTRPALDAAKAVFFLTDREQSDLITVGGTGVRLVRLGNGVPVPDANGQRGDAIEVLYLARLAPRKRPLFFTAAAAELSDEFPDVRFTLVGPDEGEAPGVERAARDSGGRVIWEGPLAPEETSRRMSHASVFVLPSVDEPYPMSVLEAMAAGLPVVVTDSCGLASAIERLGAGLVVDASQAALTGAIRKLLTDPSTARRMGAAGVRAARDEFGMAAVSAELERVYRS